MSDPTLRIFLDRSVGTKRIADALRGLEVDVQTIHDRYGSESSSVVDVRWIEDATLDGRILIGADQRIRYNRLERHAICRHQAKCFTVPRGDMTAVAMIARIEQHLDDIRRIAQLAGPYVYHLMPDRVTSMRLDCHDLEELVAVRP